MLALTRRLLFSVVTAVALAASATSASDALTSWEKAQQQLEKVSRDNAGSEDRARRISATYAQLFGEVQSMDMAKTASRDLHAMFKAAASADFYDATDAHLADLRRVMTALDDRHEAASHEVETFYGALFQGRKFDEMATFFAKHKEAGLPDPIHYRGEPMGDIPHATLTVSPIGDEVSGNKVDLAKGTHILVVAHPLCHFTQNAVAAIESDPTLQKVFERASVWISPPDRGVDIAPFQAWNKKHAETPIAIAYAGSAWPEVRIWQTPTFIFLKDGKVTGEVVGWPKEGNREALRQEMSKLPLLPPG